MFNWNSLLSRVMGVMLFVVMGLTLYWEATIIYGVAVHVTPTAWAVVLDIFLLFLFYIFDSIVFVLIGISAVALLLYE